MSLAWRNLWRVPLRTLIILSAVALGTWAAVVLSAVMTGLVRQMVDRNVKTLTGNVQIQAKDYFANPIVAHSISMPEALLEKVGPHLKGSLWTGRVKVPGVLSSARLSRPVTLVGINPEQEKPVSFLYSAVTEGRYLGTGDKHGLILGKKLAERLEARVGSKLVVMSQSLRGKGEVASAGLRVLGIYQAELQATEEEFAFMHIASLQEKLGLGDGLSEIVILKEDYSQGGWLAALKKDAGPGFEVRDWQEALPLLKSQLELYSSFTYIWLFAVILCMGFGVVNTMLMSVFDRFREFGVLKAIGMTASAIVGGILAETLVLVCLGLGTGNLMAFMTIQWLSVQGIDLSALAEGAQTWGFSRVVYPRINATDIAVINISVFIVILLSGIYPALRGSRIAPAVAMRT